MKLGITKQSLFYFSKVVTINTLLAFFCLASVAQPIKSPYQIVPDLYPTTTVRVAFHFIHKYSTKDSTNVPDNDKGHFWWNKRVDSINHYLANPVAPNYAFYKSFGTDIKLRIKNVGIYHHVDSNYWTNASIPQFYNQFVDENSNFSTFEKDSVLHSFYYGDGSWGGMSSGIPSRVGMRFKGRGNEFKIWNKWSPAEHHRNDNNYIHEMLHCFGLRHNFKNSAQGTECSGCDAELANFCFDMSKKPYAANNHMSKGPNVKPGGHSITHCQLQRILYYAWGHYPRIIGSKKDVSMLCSAPKKRYNATISDSIILNYDFRAFGDIAVKNGGTFILKSELQMPFRAKITVSQGATLIIDGGTLVSQIKKSIVTSNSSKWHFWKARNKRLKSGKVILVNDGKIITTLN